MLAVKNTQVLLPEFPKNILRTQINPCVIPNSLEDLGRFSYRNPPELCLLCVPEPSGTSSAIAGTLPAICAAALRNLIGHLHQNPPEPHQPSAPEPAGTSSAFCTGTLWKFPEPSGTFSGTYCSCTGSRQSYSGLKTPQQVLLLGKKVQHNFNRKNNLKNGALWCISFKISYFSDHFLRIAFLSGFDMFRPLASSICARCFSCISSQRRLYLEASAANSEPTRNPL